MDVLHLVILKNTIININSKQDIEYNISTIQSTLSIPYIHVFQRIHIVIHTFGTLRPFLTTLRLYSLKLAFIPLLS